MDENRAKIDDLIDALSTLLEEARPYRWPGASSNDVVINKVELSDLIDDMRNNIPDQIQLAQRIVSNANKTVSGANNNAKLILEQANLKAKELTADHEITKLAEEEAKRIISEANEKAKELRVGATLYVQDVLSRAEEVFSDSLVNYNNLANNVQHYVGEEINAILAAKNELALKTGGTPTPDDDEGTYYPDANYEEDYDENNVEPDDGFDDNYDE
jgi:vacuolar-type H+-ATPase subunit H